MIVSFRGTQMEWKDLLTDMLILQEGWTDGPNGACVCGWMGGEWVGGIYIYMCVCVCVRVVMCREEA
jgi:hypothetical protein